MFKVGSLVKCIRDDWFNLGIGIIVRLNEDKRNHITTYHTYWSVPREAWSVHAFNLEILK
jgi:hypothetical protein